MTNNDIQLLAEAYNNIQFTSEQQGYIKNWNMRPNEVPKDGQVITLAPTGHGGEKVVTLKNGEVVDIQHKNTREIIDLPAVNHYLARNFTLGHAIAAATAEKGAGGGGEDEMMLGNYDSGEPYAQWMAKNGNY